MIEPADNLGVLLGDGSDLGLHLPEFVLQVRTAPVGRGERAQRGLRGVTEVRTVALAELRVEPHKL